jgi:hypothetical protein
MSFRGSISRVADAVEVAEFTAEPKAELKLFCA